MAAQTSLSRAHAVRIWLVWLALALGCAGRLGGIESREPVHLSELSRQGDPTRRASLRLVADGLGLESEAHSARALSQYERAIQIDPNNPFAYLAIARHHVEGGDPERALEYLDQAEILLEAEGLRSPRVEPHLLGLRGAALVSAGRGNEGTALLARARALAPSVWGDARLTAAELR